MNIFLYILGVQIALAILLWFSKIFFFFFSFLIILEIFLIWDTDLLSRMSKFTSVFTSKLLKILGSFIVDLFSFYLNPLSVNSTKWSNTLKQFVGNLPANWLSVFDHFVKLVLKGLNLCRKLSKVVSYIFLTITLFNLRSL